MLTALCTKQGIIASEVLGNDWNFVKMLFWFNVSGIDYIILLTRVKDSTERKRLILEQRNYRFYLTF